MRKSDHKSGKVQQSATKTLRDQQIISKSLAGETTTAIAKDFGVSRATVTRALNGGEAQRLVSEAEGGLKLLLAKAVATIDEALDCDDMNSALKAALMVLKSAGLLEAGAQPSGGSQVEKRIEHEEVSRLTCAQRESRLDELTATFLAEYLAKHPNGGGGKPKIDEILKRRDEMRVNNEKA